MKRNQEYILQEIAGIHYLLPFGQNIAEHRKSVRLNDTGMFIWELLEKEPAYRQLAAAVAKHFSLKPEAVPEMERDLEEFLRPLLLMGIIEPDTPIHPAPADSFSAHLEIGGLSISFRGPEALYPAEFLPFTVIQPADSPLPGCGTADVQLAIEVVSGYPVPSSRRKLLILSRELELWDAGDSYVFHFPSLAGIEECILSKTGPQCIFYCIPPFDEKLADRLFHAIRFAYLTAAQRCGKFMLHSASLLYRDKAWLFSGSSGTGKSTHTNLWKEQFHTPVLNGDLNLLELTAEGVAVHGTPWCGTSGIFTVKTYPLGGITLLKQAPEDICQTLPDDKKILSVLQRMISPAWTPEMLELNLNFAGELSKRVPIFRLLCTKNPSAALIMREQIDSLQ